MSRFTRIDVAIKMKESGIIPVFFHPDIEVCKKLVDACYKGGARAIEFTNRGDFAHEVFGELNKYVMKNLPELALGIGSVLDAGTASLYIQNGADFIVSPILNPEIAKVCNRRKILWSPGCGSLSEISFAEELGAEIVKIFPAKQVGGPEFIKAVKGPMPWTNIMPTGGVTPEESNIKDWAEAGAYCIGMGSQLFIKDNKGMYDYAKITELTNQSIHFMNRYKKKV
jgi:2-dehydro-3-deoxyphosphogluconate aldolase/(4S)-4-hydroxy-2-oxoglutarate aldolase